MATSTGEVEKINVRSPFYLTVDSEGAPSSGEPLPPDYNPPSTLTQPLPCGEQINIGEDVGTRIYEVDVTDRSGDFRINYTIYTPIKITYQLTEDTSPTVIGYRGGDTREEELIELGIPPSELTNLASGDFDNSYIQITRTSDAESTLTITIEAPLDTDEYRLLMQCPDITSAPETVFSLPPTPPTDTNLLADSQTIGFTLQVFSASLVPDSTSMSVYINDSLVSQISPASLNLNLLSVTPSIIFTNISSLNWASLVTPSKIRTQLPIVVDNSSFKVGDNKIAFKLNWDTSVFDSQIFLKLMEFIRTGIFRNTTDNEYQFAWHNYQGTYSFYGFTDKYDTEVRNIANSSQLISEDVMYSFIYNTTTKNVSASTDTNPLPMYLSGESSGATGGIKV